MIVPEADRARIAESAVALGLDLEGLDEDTRGRQWRVTVVVDRDGGADLDVLTELSRELDVLAESWGDEARRITLEVSTRGVDAPLVEARHWRRAFGRKVSITYREGAGPGPETGRVGRLDEAAERVRIVSREGRAPVVQSVALSDVAAANVVVEFKTAPDDELELLSDADGGEKRGERFP